MRPASYVCISFVSSYQSTHCFRVFFFFSYIFTQAMRSLPGICGFPSSVEVMKALKAVRLFVCGWVCIHHPSHLAPYIVPSIIVWLVRSLSLSLLRREHSFTWMEHSWLIIPHTHTHTHTYIYLMNRTNATVKSEYPTSYVSWKIVRRNVAVWTASYEK